MLVFSYKVTGVTTMTITLKVPSIACEGCANTITKAISYNNDNYPKSA